AVSARPKSWVFWGVSWCHYQVLKAFDNARRSPAPSPPTHLLHRTVLGACLNSGLTSITARSSLLLFGGLFRFAHTRGGYSKPLNGRLRIFSCKRRKFAPPLLIKNVAENQVRNVIDCVVCWTSWICHSLRYERSARFDGHGPLNPW
ncbi:hypothetical protein COCC4DRAFT_194547, partial [Bipolaris maydis ATCC 48331]